MTYFYDNRPAEIEVPRLTVYPKVDSEVLADIRTQQIGRYVTYFNSFNKERSHNISLATEAINNHVVFPGETFSFNKVVGKRTAERGYLSAPVIVKGELAEGIGGGICQVSSTLFNAVDKAGWTLYNVMPIAGASLTCHPVETLQLAGMDPILFLKIN